MSNVHSCALRMSWNENTRHANLQRNSVECHFGFVNSPMASTLKQRTPEQVITSSGAQQIPQPYNKAGHDEDDDKGAESERAEDHRIGRKSLSLDPTRLQIK